MKIYLIGNAHLDPVWLWRWPEGLAEARATFTTVLELMEDFPEFRFTCAGAYVYDWIERTEPELFERIRERVRQGRWCVTGGWWIQADCNIPSGESFVRQALYAQRYFRSRFGLQCRCGYCVDSFGHAASLPKILQGCGLDGWVWMRPGEHENPNIPKPYFTWEADDGSRVTALRIADQAYACWSVEDLEKRLRDFQRRYAGGPFAEAVMVFYGVGDHGGGPTRAQLEALRKASAAGGAQVVYEHAGPEQVLDAVAGMDLPRYTGELQHHASGCYAAVSQIKRLNRRAETELATAEAWAVLARLTTGPGGPDGNLTRAWTDLLFNQFHDILAGTSLPEAYDDAACQIGGAIHAAQWTRHAARQRIAARLDTTGPGRPMIFFNNTPYPFHGVVETDDFAFFEPGNDWRFEDARGAPIPAQWIPAHSLAGRRRALLVLDIPAHGYRLIRYRPRRDGEPEPELPDPVTVTRRTIDNGRLTLRLRANGSFTLRWNHDGTLAAGSMSGLPLLLADSSDTWSHGVFRFDRGISDFILEPNGIRALETGPLRGTIQVRFQRGPCLLVLDYSLARGDDTLHIRGRLRWHDRQTLVKLRFHLPQADRSHTAEIPFAVIQRPNSGDEEVMQRWVTLAGPRGGISLLNDGKYSYDVRSGTIRITLLRSPYYAHHDPAQAPDDTPVPVTDQGEQSFHLALVPFRAAAGPGELPRRAAELHAPPECLLEGVHPGTLPPESALCACSSPEVQVAALKPAEDGRGVILRLVEMAGREQSVRVRFPSAGREWAGTLRPGEVRTVLIPWAPAAPARTVSHIET